MCLSKNIGINLVILFLLLGYHSLFAQPYIYYPQSFGEEQDHRNNDIYRFNLSTGLTELIVHDVGILLEVFCNNDQSVLFIQNRNSLDVIDLINNNQMKTIVDDLRFVQILDILDVPATNRIYVSLGSEDGAYDKTIVLNRSTYDTLITIDEFMSFHKPFISKDATKFFRFIPDSTGIFFDIYNSFDGTRIIEGKKCGNLGPFAYYADFSYGKKGIGVSRIRLKKKDNWLTQQYVVCDPEQGKTFGIIPFPYRSEAFLNGDASYVIIEQVNFDKTRESAEYRPGNISLFDAKSGVLLHQLKLPPEGKILLFDNYPNMLYYYLYEEQRSINIDLSKLSNITSLNPNTAHVGSQSFTLTVSGKNFTSGSTVYWNNSPRTTTLISDSVIEANISASDLVRVDSPLVTVKQPITIGLTDSVESNGIRFYIQRQMTVISVQELLDSLRAKLRQCYERKQIGDSRFFEELDDHLKDAKREYLKKDTIGCALELEDFQQILKSEFLAKPKKNDKRYVSESAYRELYITTNNIISSVLNLPPRSTGTITTQIGLLQTELRKAERENNIGGKLLVPALNLMLEIAKKELQKEDSLSASLQIALFKQTIREIYELTQRHPKTKNYVTAKVFIVLYYGAKNILEQLPEPDKKNLPKLDRELEKELKQEVVE